MDPDANLAQQRELAARIIALIDAGEGVGIDRDAVVDAAGDLAELVQALDEWRRKGGFEVDTEPAPVMLVIRDPDNPTEYVTDSHIEVLSIDTGGSWNGYKDLAAAAAEGDPHAIDYLAHHLADAKRLPMGSAVGVAIERFVNDMLDGAPDSVREQVERGRV